MTNKDKLAVVKAVHTVIYMIMAGSTLFIVYAGIVRYRGVVLTVSLILVSIEGVVFFANGMKCPLTRVAQNYGAVKGYAFDTFLPEKATRYTFRFFGGLLIVGIVLLIFNR